MEMIKKAILIVVLVLLSFALINCQTVQGFGKDVQWTGEKTAELLEGE